jgi:dTDP-4-amino-4,6-dideoxygalactose transaminase
MGKFKFNYAYFPVVFSSEDILLRVKSTLELKGINTRRYFYPSLNTLSFLSKTNSCPVSENIALRVLCLPLYPELSEEEADTIASIIIKVME